MRLAIIALEETQPKTATVPQETFLAIKEARDAQALALARNCGTHNLEPWLFVSPKSQLAGQAALDKIPAIIMGGYLDQSWRLWRWRKEGAPYCALVLGTSGLKLGERLAHKNTDDSGVDLLVFSPADLAGFKNSKAISRYLCGCETVRESLRQLMDAREAAPDFAITAPGIDVDSYHYRDSRQPERFVFGMGGSLLPHSGALLTVRAMSALWQQSDLLPWEIRMFGSGPRFDEIMEEAEKLGVLPRLSILGDQPLSEVTRHCDAWIAPGSGDFELAETLWAGFAARLPVIASSSAFHLERLNGKQAALLIPPGNPQELAKLMLRIMREKDLRKQMISAGSALLPQISLAGMTARVFEAIRRKAPDRTDEPKPAAKQKNRRIKAFCV